MRALTLPVIRKQFIERLGRTAVECQLGNATVTVWASGNREDDPSLLANIVINEIGDKFTASKDSSTNDDKGKPIYKKGDVVTRQKQSEEFKSFAGNNAAAQFAQSASAFGLQLNVIMQG